jgi:hypothetical protein
MLALNGRSLPRVHPEYLSCSCALLSAKLKSQILLWAATAAAAAAAAAAVAAGAAAAAGACLDCPFTPIRECCLQAALLSRARQWLSAPTVGHALQGSHLRECTAGCCRSGRQGHGRGTAASPALQRSGLPALRPGVFTRHRAVELLSRRRTAVAWAVQSALGTRRRADGVAVCRNGRTSG